MNTPNIPRFRDPSFIPENALLPAVSAVACAGFLSVSAPVASFGPAKAAHVYLLLRHEDRALIGRDVTVDGYLDSVPGHPFVKAILRPNGENGSWWNGESLWVSAEWLRAVRLVIDSKLASVCHGTRLAFMLLDMISEPKPAKPVASGRS